MMPPAAAMAAWLPALFNARCPKAKQASSFTSRLPECAFMVSTMHCRGEVWEDLGCMRVNKDGAIVTYGRILLGWGNFKGKREFESCVRLVR